MNKPKLEVTVGIFVVVGFILLTLVVLGVSGVYFLRPGYHLSADFDYVGIIDRGAPVRFAGVKVGEVKDVQIIEPSETEKGFVRMTFFVVNGVEIRQNDKISIQGTHIMSEPHIEIEPSMGERGRILKNGDVVKGVNPISTDQLLNQGKEIVEKVNRFLGEMDAAIKDTGGWESMRRSLVNLGELTGSLNQIIKGEEVALRKGMVSISQSAEQLDQLLNRMNRGEGTIGKLMVDEGLYQEMKGFVTEIKQHPWRLLKK